MGFVAQMIIDVGIAGDFAKSQRPAPILDSADQHGANPFGAH